MKLVLTRGPVTTPGSNGGIEASSVGVVGGWKHTVKESQFNLYILNCGRGWLVKKYTTKKVTLMSFEGTWGGGWKHRKTKSLEWASWDRGDTYRFGSKETRALFQRRGRTAIHASGTVLSLATTTRTSCRLFYFAESSLKMNVSLRAAFWCRLNKVLVHSFRQKSTKGQNKISESTISVGV